MKKIYASVLLLPLLAASACQNKKAPEAQAVTRPVLEVQTQSCTLYKPYSASLLANGAVAVYPKVSGYIFYQHANEGDWVKKGDKLFTIDPIQMQAAVDVAKANVEAAKAQVQTAQLTFDTKNELFQKDIISANDLQVARNSLASAKANLEQCRAALTNARRNLEYCEVTSPIDGILGVISYSPGNLVSSSSAQPLTTVTDIRTMRCYFSISEREALQLSRRYGTPAQIAKSLPEVSLRLSDGSMYPRKGKVITVSGVPDPRTGSIRIRADFPNPDLLIKNGYTGTVLMPVTEDSAVLIPQKATFEVQSERFVYVVNDSNVLEAVTIKISELNDGENYVVTSGLKAGDCIVTEGVNFLHNGQKILRK